MHDISDVRRRPETAERRHFFYLPAGLRIACLPGIRLGLVEAREHGIDSDAPRPELLRHHAREHVHGGLAHAVYDDFRQREARRCRGEIHDMAALAQYWQ